MPTAVVFPGQASQTPDMRERVAATRPDLLALVCERMGEDPFPRVDESTRFAQPAIFCAGLAGWARLRDEEPVAVAGHSLGELTALTAAGALSETDALDLVVLRGSLMSEARSGSMIAALGGDAATVADLARRHGVTVANDNAPGQLVLSGGNEALRAAKGELRDSGIRALELNVAGAFHSPLMADATAPFAAAVHAVDMRAPRLAFISSVTAAAVDDPGEIRRLLAAALTQPVRWRETVAALHAAGVDRFAEAGPGQVLTRLIRRTLTGVEAFTADRLEEAAHA